MFRHFYLLFATATSLCPQTVVEIWPDGRMPGKGANAPEAEVPRKDGFHRITNVSKPSLTFF